MQPPFGTRLRAAMDERGPLCVGIDPHPALLSQWGLSDDPAGLERFSLTCVEALAGQLAVLKPQSAFFERHGAAGIAVLERTIAEARSQGCLVLLDAKRGDIGSTMQAYADAYLEPSSPLAVDALTVNPYLGFGSLQPVIDTALSAGGGVFVVALTSNPEGRCVQAALTKGRSVAGDILHSIATANSGCDPMGSVGAVVAANLPEVHEDLAINGPLLAPGLGAQGGTAEGLRRIFGGQWRQVLPSTSRELLATGPDIHRLRAAAQRTTETVSDVLG